jgi:hypothetical protein
MNWTSLQSSVMKGSGTWLLLGVALQGCGGPPPASETDLRAEMERSFAPYERVATEFLSSAADRDYHRSYELLAPSYTNMVSEGVFAARIKENGNFKMKYKVEILKTVSRNGSTTARCQLGDLGLAEFVFLDLRDGPRISAIMIGGLPALPAP